jgi:hypothetical protein
MLWVDKAFVFMLLTWIANTMGLPKEPKQMLPRIVNCFGYI